jgi:hypothetical protein
MRDPLHAGFPGGPIYGSRGATTVGTLSDMTFSAGKGVAHPVAA